MQTKDEIRNNPTFVRNYTQGRYNDEVLFIEIELTNQKNNLFLCSQDIGICLGKEKKVHDYDDKGRRYFKTLIENFGRVWVAIPGRVPVKFDDYESLLDEISSR